MVWFWDADTGEYVFQPEESGSTVTAERLRWEDLAEDRTTWQGEDGGMLALRADEALYTYRTWYGRKGQGDLWDIGNRQVLLRYGDGSYLLARSGSGFLDRLGQPNAVERMDHRHERHDHLHFIGLQMADQDVFVNVVGGVKVTETSADLALLLAMVSSLRDRPLPQDLVVFGEVGLAGEIRPVPSGQERISEAAKHGFRRAIVPAANVPKKAPEGMQIFGVKKLSDALSVFDDL